MRKVSTLLRYARRQCHPLQRLQGAGLGRRRQLQMHMRKVCALLRHARWQSHPLQRVQGGHRPRRAEFLKGRIPEGQKFPRGRFSVPQKFPKRRISAELACQKPVIAKSHCRAFSAPLKKSSHFPSGTSYIHWQANRLSVVLR